MERRSAASSGFVASMALGALVLAVPGAAFAYVGPGAGMGILGVLLAVLAAVLMAAVGLVLWPIRMITHRRKLKAREAEKARSAASAEPSIREQNTSARGEAR